MILKVKFEKPDGASVADIAEFVDNALTTWGGQLRPDDPLFHSLKLEYIEVHGQRFEPAK